MRAATEEEARGERRLLRRAPCTRPGGGLDAGHCAYRPCARTYAHERFIIRSVARRHCRGAAPTAPPPTVPSHVDRAASDVRYIYSTLAMSGRELARHVIIYYRIFPAFEYNRSFYLYYCIIDDYAVCSGASYPQSMRVTVQVESNEAIRSTAIGIRHAAGQCAAQTAVGRAMLACAYMGPGR